jgi:hypothetical protein
VSVLAWAGCVLHPSCKSNRAKRVDVPVCRLTASARTKLRSGLILSHNFSISNKPVAAQTIALQHLQVQDSVRIRDDTAMPISGFVR